VGLAMHNIQPLMVKETLFNVSSRVQIIEKRDLITSYSLEFMKIVRAAKSSYDE